MSEFREFAEACPFRVDVPIERRPGNALNIEIGKALDRCRALPPDHWPNGMVGRWIGSGGSPLVLGCCAARTCPRK